MEIFTTNFSVFSNWRLPERLFRLLLKGIDRKRQKVFFSQCASVDMASCQLIDFQNAPGLRIAKTTLPDERLDFNKTFEQIRFGLDDFYKERNPVFNSLLVSEGEGSRPVLNRTEGRLFETPSKPVEFLEIYHKEEDENSAPDADISPLWIAKTTIPEGRRDFNETFFHIRNEIEKIYKEQNPVFNNTISPELWLSPEAQAERQESPDQEFSCHKAVAGNHSEESDSNNSEITLSGAEGVEATFGVACSQLTEVVDHQYPEMEKPDDDFPWVLEDVCPGGSAYLPDSLAALGNFAEHPAVAYSVPKPVPSPLAEGSIERACSSPLIRQEKKKRKIHRPARMSWNYKNRKEKRQEKIPEAEPGRYGDEE